MFCNAVATGTHVLKDFALVAGLIGVQLVPGRDPAAFTTTTATRF